MKNVWELFPMLTEVVRLDHDGKDCGHHPFEHALMVAQYCLLIAPDEKTGRLAAIAGLLHNTDRLFPTATPEEIEQMLKRRISSHATLGGGDTYDVTTAVLEHSKKNSDDDEPVTVCLKDADRLANINPFDVTARSARLYTDLPLVDPRFVMTMDPESTYRDPKTVFRDAILSTLEWKTWLRLPKAKVLAQKYFSGLRVMQELTSEQHIETGLGQYKL